MPYCTLDNLKLKEPLRQIIQLSDDTPVNDPAHGTVGMDNVADAIKEADTLIDSYLRGHVGLPFDVVPDIICQISAELAICNLYQRRMGSSIPDSITARRKSAESKLKEIVAGTIIISEKQKAEQPAGTFKHSSRKQIFTENRMQQYFNDNY